MFATSQAAAPNRYEIHEGRRLQFYPKGSEIPAIAQGVWQVSEGLVEINTLSIGGEQVLLGWATSGGFFGYWLFQSLKEINQPGRPSLFMSCQALSDVYLKWYTLSEIETSPHLCQMILPYLAKRMRQSEILLAIAGQKRVEDRLIRLLLLLKQDLGQSVPGGTCIKARLTHQHLASAINTTRVTVTRLLKQFQYQGWISLDLNRHIILKDGCFPSVSDW